MFYKEAIMTQPFEAPSSSSPKNPSDFATEEQPQARVDRVWGKVVPLLVPGETIEHVVVQGMTAMKLIPGALVLTNRRAIFAQSGLFKLSFHDLPWRLLLDAHLTQGAMGATLVLTDIQRQEWQIEHLPKQLASRAYAYAQAVEELAIEYRRQRQLEEVRAASRGVSVHDLSPAPIATPIQPPAETVESALGQLKRLADQGLISEQEYEAKKADILSRL